MASSTSHPPETQPLFPFDRLNANPFTTTALLALIPIVLFFAFRGGHSPINRKDGTFTPTEASWAAYLAGYAGSGPGFWNTGEDVFRRFPGGIFSLPRRNAHQPKALVLKSDGGVDSEPVKNILANLEPLQNTQLLPSWRRSLFGFSNALPKLTTLNTAVDNKAWRLVSEESIAQLKRNLADLVTFNTSEVDQTEWERLASSEAIETPGADPAMEADLFELIKNFAAYTTAAAVYGANFADNLPEIWPAFWDFDAGAPRLAVWGDSWDPLFGVRKGNFARRKVKACLREFLEAMDVHLAGQDPGAKWQDLEQVSSLVRDRVKRYRDATISMDERVALELEQLWLLNAQTKPLIFWTLYSLYGNPVLLATVREEMEPLVEIVAPRSQFSLGVWTPPEVTKFDMDGMYATCHELKAAVVGAAREHGLCWSRGVLARDVTIRGRDGEKYLLEKGSCVHIQHPLFDTTSSSSTTTKGVKSFGSSEWAVREVMMFTAMIVAMWDVSLPPGSSRQWSKVRARRAGSGDVPTRACRVWVRRRELPMR